MTGRVHVWCQTCRWTGKRPADSNPDGWACPRCDVLPTPLVRGYPPTGNPVGRPPTPAHELAAQRLRKHAADLLAIADDLDSARK